MLPKIIQKSNDGEITVSTFFKQLLSSIKSQTEKASNFVQTKIFGFSKKDNTVFTSIHTKLNDIHKTLSDINNNLNGKGDEKSPLKEMSKDIKPIKDNIKELKSETINNNTNNNFDNSNENTYNSKENTYNSNEINQETKKQTSLLTKIIKQSVGSVKEDRGALGFLTNPGKMIQGLGLTFESPILMMVGDKLSNLIKEQKEEKQVLKDNNENSNKRTDIIQKQEREIKQLGKTEKKELNIDKRDLKLNKKEHQEQNIKSNLTEGIEGVDPALMTHSIKSSKFSLASLFKNHKLSFGDKPGEGSGDSFFSNMLEYEMSSKGLGIIGKFFGKKFKFLSKIPGIGKLFPAVEKEGGSLLSKILPKTGVLGKVIPKALSLGKFAGADLLTPAMLAYGTVKGGLFENSDTYKDKSYDASKHGFISRTIHGMLRPDKAVEGLTIMYKEISKNLYHNITGNTPEKKEKDREMQMVKNRASPKVIQTFKKEIENSENPFLELVKLQKSGKIILKRKNKKGYYVMPSENINPIKTAVETPIMTTKNQPYKSILSKTHRIGILKTYDKNKKQIKDIKDLKDLNEFDNLKPKPPISQKENDIKALKDIDTDLLYVNTKNLKKITTSDIFDNIIPKNVPMIVKPKNIPTEKKEQSAQSIVMTPSESHIEKSPSAINMDTNFQTDGIINIETRYKLLKNKLNRFGK